MHTYASCETTSNIGELQQLRSIKNTSLFRQTIVDYICSSFYFVVSLQSESFFCKREIFQPKYCWGEIKYLGAIQIDVGKLFCQRYHFFFNYVGNCSLLMWIRKADSSDTLPQITLQYITIISRISREFWADNNFFEYLLLRFFDFKLLVGVRTVRKIMKSQTFQSTNWVLFIFWRPAITHYWKLTISRKTIPNRDMLKVN